MSLVILTSDLFTFNDIKTVIPKIGKECIFNFG